MHKHSCCHSIPIIHLMNVIGSAGVWHTQIGSSWNSRIARKEMVLIFHQLLIRVSVDSLHITFFLHLLLLQVFHIYLHFVLKSMASMQFVSGCHSTVLFWYHKSNIMMKWSLKGDGIHSAGFFDSSLSKMRSNMPPYLRVEYVDRWMKWKWSINEVKQLLCSGDFWSKLKSPRTISLS